VAKALAANCSSSEVVSEMAVGERIASPQDEGPIKGTPRAPRFPIQAALRYRVGNETDWLEGETVNISRTGILFRARKQEALKTPIEMSFNLPVTLADESGAIVFCQGEIVRTVLPPASDSPPRLAARILEYRFARQQGAGEA
jgi:hypothetical protein